MPHRANVHDSRTVIDRIDHTILPDANSPQVVRSLKLHASRWPGIRCERFDPRDDPPGDADLKPFEFPSGLEQTVRWYQGNKDWLDVTRAKYDRQRLGTGKGSP